MSRTPMQSSRSAGWDLLLIAVLAAVALEPLGTAYAGTDWRVVGLVGVALGIGCAVLSRAAGAGLELTVPALVGVYMLLGGMVALRDPGLFAGVPDSRVLGELGVGAAQAWTRLLETAGPVDSAGELLLLPWMLGLAAGGLPAALALSPRSRVGWPLLPLVLVLGASILLGGAELRSQPGPALLFPALAVAWLLVRARRLQPEPAGGAAAAVSAGLVCLIVLGLALVVAPLREEVGAWLPQRVDLRERVLGYDASTTTTPLSTFRRYTSEGEGSEHLRRAALFRLDGLEAGTRMRIATLDAYDGLQWYAGSAADPDTNDDRYLYLPSRLGVQEKGEEVNATVRVRSSWDLPWVPVAGRLVRLDFFGDVDPQVRESLRYNPSTGSVLVPGGLQRRENYSFSAVLPADSLTRSMRPWPEVDPDLFDQAEFVDVAAQQLAGDAGRPPMTRLFRAGAELRRLGRYADEDFGWLDVPPGQTSQRLGEDFLHAPRPVGNDEQYAAAMALIAVRLGVPARVVVGAKVPERGAVRGRHVHAWVEVRVRDGSWRVLPTKAFMSHRPPTRKDLLRDPLPQRRPQPPNRQPQSPRNPEQQSQDEPEQDERQDTQNEDRSRPWWLLAALPMLLPLVKLGRRELRRRRGSRTRRLAGAWAEVRDLAVDLGWETPARSTRPGQASVWAHGREEAEVSTGSLALARRVDEGVFDLQPPEEPAVVDGWSQADQIRRGMRAASPRWRRALAWFSPGSLRRRW